MQLKIYPGVVRTTGNDIKSKAASFKTGYTKIFNETKNLRNSWKGDAAKRHLDAIDKYSADFQKFYDTSYQMGEFVYKVGDDNLKLEKNL